MSTNQSASGTAGDNQSEAAAGAEDIDDGSVTPSQRFFSSSQLAGDPEQVTDVEKANGDDLIAWTDERPGSGRVGQAEWPNVNSTAAIHHRANSDTSLLASNTWSSPAMMKLCKADGWHVLNVPWTGHAVVICSRLWDSIITSAKEVMFLPVFVCLCVSKITQKGQIFLKFWGYVGHGTNYQWFNFGRDPAGILDSGSLWNFHYHCIKGGIKEPLQNRRWWRHLANNCLGGGTCGLWLLSSSLL